ncbi:MAG: DUF433 domain-containing protein [Acidimicrobiia bacterium]
MTGPRRPSEHPKKGDIRFSIPLYSAADAARAVDVPAATFARWVRRGPGSVVTSLPPAGSGQPSIPFVGLTEGLVLAAIRRAGMPLQRIRPALVVLNETIGGEHALASRALYTDGAAILFDYAERAGEHDGAPARNLVAARRGQRVFIDVVDHYLRGIEYDPDDGYARLFRLPAYGRAEVVADPDRSFGQPIFARGGARLTDVLERFWAGDELGTVAEEFGVPVAEFEDVLRVASRRAA